MKITKTFIAEKLKKVGWRIHSGEDTSGAKKYWLEGGNKAEAKIILRKLGAKSSSNNPYEFHGNGWEAHFQGKDEWTGKQMLFIEVYRQNSAGRLHKMGIDN
jgi:hypothetical protein